MSNQKNEEQSKPAEISPEQIEAFLTDHKSNAEKHGLDFAINYEMTEDGAVKAKFVIVPKPNDENNTEEASQEATGEVSEVTAE